MIAACEWAEIRTLRYRIQFDTGCKISIVRGDPVQGMEVEGLLRHDGNGFAELADCFSSIIVPANVRPAFNGDVIPHRQAERTVEGMELPTVVYDPKRSRWKRFNNLTSIAVLPQWGDGPMIYELGIPVDRMPWSLPYDINVLQKTPLDTERDMLPARYKDSLLQQLVSPLSDEFRRATEEHGVPDEIAGDVDLAGRLSDDAKEAVVRTTTGADPKMIVRRNPFDADDPSESAELEQRHGYKPVNLGHLPRGVAHLLKDAPTVSKTHDEVCKVHFRHGQLPPETRRQRECMEMYAALASAILKRTITCERGRGSGFSAAWKDVAITLNIDVSCLWDDPLGEESVGIILHECAHDKTSGHSVAFQDEIAGLGARLAAWVADNPSWWQEWHRRLYGGDATPPAGA